MESALGSWVINWGLQYISEALNTYVRGIYVASALMTGQVCGELDSPQGFRFPDTPVRDQEVVLTFEAAPANRNYADWGPELFPGRVQR
jgi:hypothetical protein